MLLDFAWITFVITTKITNDPDQVKTSPIVKALGWHKVRKYK